jgi:hypothetical protein
MFLSTSDVIVEDPRLSVRVRVAALQQIPRPSPKSTIRIYWAIPYAFFNRARVSASTSSTLPNTTLY